MGDWREEGDKVEGRGEEKRYGEKEKESSGGRGVKK